MTAAQIAARLEQTPIARVHLEARVLVGFATFFDGVDALSIAYVLPVLAGAWHLSPREIGFLISVGYLGQLLGAIACGWLADRIGRLKTMAYTVAVFSVFSLACMVSWSYSSLMLFRALQGLGLGGEVPIAAAYINELSQAKTRGRFVLLYELVYPAGRVAAALAGAWIAARFGWRFVFLLGGLPAVLVFFLRRRLPESPRWLASRGRLEDADQAVRKLELRPPDATGVPSYVSRNSREIPERAPWTGLFRGIYLSRTLIIWVLWGASYGVLNGLSTWVPTLYHTAFKTSIQTSAYYGLLTSAAGLAGCVAVALTIDWTGRRSWFIMAFGVAGLSFLALWSAGASSEGMVLAYTSIGSCFINAAAMALFLYTPELYPTQLRALGCSVASAWLRLASIIGPMIVALTIEAHSLAAVFLEFGVACVIAFVVSLFCVETKGRAIEDISPELCAVD